MKNIFFKITRILPLLVFIIACSKKKDKIIPDENGNTKEQFHKVVLADDRIVMIGTKVPIYSGNSINNQPELVYSISDANFKWLRFGGNAQPLFKKSIVLNEGVGTLELRSFEKSDNGYLVGGIYRGSNTFPNLFIAGYSDDGSLQFSKQISYAKSVNPLDLNKLSLNPMDDGYIATSSILNTVIKLDKNGSLIWNLRLRGYLDTIVGYTGEYVMDFPSIENFIVDKEGNIFVGLSLGNGYYTSSDLYLICINKDGNVQWCKELNPKDSYNNFQKSNSFKKMLLDDFGDLVLFIETSLGKIMMAKMDKNGNVLKTTQIGDDTNEFGRYLFEVKYVNQHYFLLVGTDNFARCVALELDGNFKPVKQGVVLSASGLSPQTFYSMSYSVPNSSFTDFIIIALDLQDRDAFQYVRLDDKWKYPFYDYSNKPITTNNNISLIIKNRPLEKLSTYIDRDPTNYKTSDLATRIEDNVITNMHVEDYSE